MMKKVALGIATLALALASAAESHRFTLYQPATVNGTELKPGDYKIEITDNKAVIKQGKQSVEATVRLENSDEKFGNTSVRFSNGAGKYALQEIRVGGTKTKVVFEAPAVRSGAE
jgi:hypothetical protein